MNNKELIPLLPEMAIFVAVAEEQSFSKAGLKLGIAASSVSRAIQRLEDNLQLKLLERTTRRVRLSDAGQDVYKQCKAMMDAAKAAIQAANSTHNEGTGLLRVAAPKAFAKLVLTPLILDFMEQHPKITMQFKVVDHLVDPMNDEVDVIFRLTHQPMEGLISKTLSTSDLVLFASPAYIEQNGIPAHPNDLTHHQCITFGEKPGDDEWTLTNAEQRVNIKTNPHFSANHTEIRKAAALRNMGIAISSDFSVKQELMSGELIQVLADWHVSGNYQGLVVLQYAQSRFIPVQIRLFVDYITSAFDKQRS